MSINTATIHLEVGLHLPKSQYNLNHLEESIRIFLKSNMDIIRKQESSTSNRICITGTLSPELSKMIASITYDDNLLSNNSKIDKDSIIFHFYKNNVRASEIEILDNCASSDDDIEASQHWILPNIEFENLWETLLYDENIKENILKYAETSVIFGKYNINKNLVACNRIILLHGPPGTGKTSLCKAIAQKISIRQNNLYKFTHLVEVNSHSLFSKWFSESGKLVQKLFSKIKELIDQPNSLVCVLIDEIESIAYSRSSISNDEPKDSIRVVNAVLTQLDQIKQYSNVLILATSNLQSSIDAAFLDRVDLKQFISYPAIKAIYLIYMSALVELVRVGIINADDQMKFKSYERIINHELKNDENNVRISKSLLDLSRSSYGLSGRTLRKIPFLAHALNNNNITKISEIQEFLNLMQIVVEKYLKEEISLNTLKI